MKFKTELLYYKGIVSIILYYRKNFLSPWISAGHFKNDLELKLAKKEIEEWQKAIEEIL